MIILGLFMKIYLILKKMIKKSLNIEQNDTL